MSELSSVVNRSFPHTMLVKVLISVIFIAVLNVRSFTQHTAFNLDTTVTWTACINSYKELDEQNENAKLLEIGSTDVGKSLHLFVINNDGIFYPELFDHTKVILFINNGIHPGEPDGIDASLIWCREILDKQNELSQLLDSVIICVIPVYNVDGCLNRRPGSRANQDGPQEYGFRGNARNLDLNRDFIKCDSRNAKSFAGIFTRTKPTVFVDTHVSNGADYPYTMTLISTQSDKLGGSAGSYLREKMTPALFSDMKLKGWEMCPYVNTMGRTPETGLVEFLESPRFASGYAALYNTLGFITETHMLKPFAQRTESTYQFLVSILKYCDVNATELVKIRKEADLELSAQQKFALGWETDTSAYSMISFNGYETAESKSNVMDGMRWYYDHNKPWTHDIRYYNKCRATNFVDVPRYYLLPQAWHEVTEILELNGVIMEHIERDTIINVECSYLRNVRTRSEPYEGHYIHTGVDLEKDFQGVTFYSGDFLIPLDQPAKRFLVETLEPNGEDSFFSWNFFDSCLQQKEWFSDYVFEEKAAELLRINPQLKTDLEAAMKQDPELAGSHWAQLYWIYQRSPYYEKSAFRYPVYKLY